MYTYAIILCAVMVIMTRGQTDETESIWSYPINVTSSDWTCTRNATSAMSTMDPTPSSSDGTDYLRRLQSDYGQKYDGCDDDLRYKDYGGDRRGRIYIRHLWHVALWMALFLMFETLLYYIMIPFFISKYYNHLQCDLFARWKITLAIASSFHSTYLVSMYFLMRPIEAFPTKNETTEKLLLFSLAYFIADMVFVSWEQTRLSSLLIKHHAIPIALIIEMYMMSEQFIALSSLICMEITNPFSSFIQIRKILYSKDKSQCRNNVILYVMYTICLAICRFPLWTHCMYVKWNLWKQSVMEWKHVVMLSSTAPLWLFNVYLMSLHYHALKKCIYRYQRLSL